MYLLDSLQTKERKYYVYRFSPELLQFIFKSALSKGSEIWIYIPSIRMRNLLKQWINKNSLENK